jgi:phospholipase/carboxylesterase
MSDPRTTRGPLEQDPDFKLSFRLRQPVPAAPRACVVLLHGVGGNEMNLADLATGIDADTLVVLARGRLQMGAGQFAWFRVSFTASGPRIVATEAEQSRSTLIRFVEQIQRKHGIVPAKTVIAGFSQGGIMSAGVALSAPELVAGFAILSGRILPELEPQLAPAARLAHLRAFIGHGELDGTLPVIWAHRADEWLNKLGVTFVSRRYPIDHSISSEMQSDFLQWVQEMTSR